ncbi:MAG: Trk system potassium transporter TrkA [Mahellales bacterium]|jgi:trk system potassium uptake protein TrkA
MKIIIIGAGKVGYYIAETLSRELHDVIVIDKDQSVLDKINENLDVLTVKANGLSGKILKENNVKNSHLLIAVTDSDEANMLACMTAKRLGCQNTIARIRDPEYANELVFSKEELGVDLIINPEQAAAHEITRLLTITPALHVEDFANGKVRMVELSISQSSSIINKEIKTLKIPDSLLITAIARNGDIIIPDGESKILPGDTVYVLGKIESVTDFCQPEGKPSRKVNNVMILGGGRLGFYLAQNLSRLGLKVKIIEQNHGRCDELCEQIPGILVINADGTDVDLLEAENINQTDAFIAVTGIDEENLLVSLLAKKMGAQRVIAKVGRPNYAPLVETLGIDAAISPRLITASDILRFVRGGKIVSLSLLMGGQAEVIEMIAQKDSPAVDKPLKEVGFPKGVIVGSIVHRGKVVVPKGSDIIRANDRVIVFTLSKHVAVIKSFFATSNKGGKKIYEFWRNNKNARPNTHI